MQHQHTSGGGGGGGGGAGKLTLHDTSVATRLTAERFKDDYDDEALLELLSGELVRESKRLSRSFDARPLIRAFEFAATELGSLRAGLDRQIVELARQVEKTEAENRQQMKKIRKEFVYLGRSFDTIEGQITYVGNNTVQVGEQLEAIDREMTRAADIRDIMDYLADFAVGRSERIEQLYLDGAADGLSRAAVIARQLQMVARDDEIPGATRAREHIDKFCEWIERNLLEQFDHAMNRSDHSRTRSSMATYARALWEFNGGASCIKAYIEQHEFFRSSRHSGEALAAAAQASYAEMAGVEDMFAPPPPHDSQLVQLCSEIAKTVQKEWRLILSVFPEPLSVAQALVGRVFEQTLRLYIEALVGAARTRQSRVAELRVVASAHSVVRKTVASLKKFDADIVQPSISDGPSPAATFARVLRAQTGAAKGTSTTSGSGGAAAAAHSFGWGGGSGGIGGDGSATAFDADGNPIPTGSALSTTLEHCLEELFEPYISAGRADQTETQFLRMAFDEIVAPFADV
ncbi:Sec10-domain-containing protein, partial [Ramicandelaber brevisporus]